MASTLLHFFCAIGSRVKGFEDRGLALGWQFLFSGIYFWTQKSIPDRIPEDFFFSCVLLRNFSQERGFGGGRSNSCFFPILQEFFTGIPVGQEFLYLLRIPQDS